MVIYSGTHLINVHLIGDEGVGKTTLLYSIRYGRYFGVAPSWQSHLHISVNEVACLGLLGNQPSKDASLEAWVKFSDLTPREAAGNGTRETRTHNIRVWDVTGQWEKALEEEDIDGFLDFHTTPRDRMPDAIGVCFSIGNRSSYDSLLNRWLPEILHLARGVPIILLGCQSDLRQNPERSQFCTTMEEGMKMASNIGALCYFECSSKADNNSIIRAFRILGWAGGQYKTKKVVSQINEAAAELEAAIIPRSRCIVA